MVFQGPFHGEQHQNPTPYQLKLELTIQSLLCFDFGINRSPFQRFEPQQGSARCSLFPSWCSKPFLPPSCLLELLLSLCIALKTNSQTKKY